MTADQKTILTIAQAIADELKPTVKEIEDSIPTTKDHYGDYLTILTAEEDTTKRAIIALALIEAGASKDGVRSAYHIITGG